jgi:signal transduction histidine kinase
MQLPGHVFDFADEAMTSTILRNLISNAVKFTNPGGKVQVFIEQKADELMIVVSDNGVGIKPEAVKRLFRIDENHSTLGTQNEKGTGLGLILCKEFVEKHSGRIWVESIAGKGSQFYFTIPIK